LFLGVCGLALAIPGGVMAAPLGDDEAGYETAGTSHATQHHHKGWLHRRHCAECQRAYVKEHDGVDVPAPPPLERSAGTHNHWPGQGAPCSVCEGNAVVSGPVMAGDPHAPGYAVVGESGVMANANAPGYAVVGGEAAPGFGPAPIGVYRAGGAQSADPRMAAAARGPGAGPYDPSVVPTNLPPAQVALAGPGADRPHIIGHLFGIPKFGRISRERAEREREKHAAIAYDQPNHPVTELPASLVYDKNGK
jgi:hypothetical protein